MSTTPNNPGFSPRTRGTRKTVTAAEALPGAVLLPLGITETDPAKALPMVIERLNGVKEEHKALCKDKFDLSEEVSRLTTQNNAAKSRITGLELSVKTSAADIERLQKERDEALLKITSLETSAKWNETETAKIQEAKENLWADYQTLQKERDVLVAQAQAQTVRTRALVSLFGTFDKDKEPPQESQIVTAVNGLFLERDNARRCWEIAQNNVNRLKNENDRLSATLGMTFDVMKNAGIEIEEYADIPEAIQVMAVAAKDAETEILGLGKAADWWRGAAGWLGVFVFLLVMVSFWKAVGK